MNSRRLQFLVLILGLGALVVQAQGIKIEKYQQEDGLPNDLVKSIVFDQQGYLWVATDDGIVKLQGRKFIPIKTPAGFSNNFKTLYSTTKGDFFAAADKGILKITETFDSIYSERLFNTSDFKEVLGFYYPKTIYQASDNTIWFADMHDLFQFKNGELIRYEMASKNHADHYSRSYRIFEMGNALYTISQKGYVYKFNCDKGVFDEIQFSQQGTEVFSHLVLNDKVLLLGNKNGLFELVFGHENKPDIAVKTLNFNLPVSEIVLSPDSSLVLGTWGNGAFYYSYHAIRPESRPISGTESTTVNDIAIDPNNALWVATNEGLIQIREIPFSSPFAHLTKLYVQDVHKAGNGLIYFADGEAVWEYDRKAKEIKLFYEAQNGLIIRLASDKSGLFMSTNNGYIIKKEFKGKTSIIDYTADGEGIYNLIVDSFENIWFIQSQPQKQAVLCQTPDGKLVDYTPQNAGINNSVRSLRLMANGQLLMGGNGNDSYLYRFNQQKREFENISLPIPFVSNLAMGTVDMAYDADGILYLATTMGIWQYYNDTMVQLNLGKFNNELTTAIAFDSHNRLWAANSNGLILYNNGIESTFNNNDGLPAKTINYRALLIDEQDQIFAGTISGLATAQINFDGLMTPKPQIWSCNYSGVQVNPYAQNEYIEKNILNFQLSCPVYPSKFIQYSYKLTPGNADWQYLERGADLIILTSVKTGKYNLQVRSKFQGYYKWSEPFSYEFIVKKAWYMRVGFLVFLYGFILMAIYGYVMLLKRKGDRERNRLERIITERTKALQDRNEELTLLNTQLEEANSQADRAIKSKDRFFSILAHDLKSAFNTLIGFSQLLVSNRDELSAQDMKVLLGEMLNTSENTYKLLQNLLDWARTQTGSLKINPERIALNELMNEVLNIVGPAAKQKRINIIVSIPDQFYWYTDVSIAATVLRNVITNAIKFSFPGSKINIDAEMINQDGVIHVIDYGVGISREKIQKLFSIETSSSTKGTTDEKGTGLGLVLCKELIEKSNGSISVESHVGLGSKFSIKLPLYQHTDSAVFSM